jgi:hypothetical protein
MVPCTIDAASSTRRRRGQRPDAGEDGVAHRRGQLDAAGGERLGHEERVAGGPAMQRGGIDAVRRGQLGHRRERQRQQPQAVGRPLARQLTQRHAQRVPTVQLVVAVAGDQQRRDARDPPAAQPQHVERRLVGPVHVLEHDDRRPAQLAQERRGHDVRRCALRHRRGELAAGDRADVLQGTQRGEREERVALTPQDLRVAVLAEAAQQGGLADARLAGHEHQPAAARHERGVERRERVRALQQRALDRGDGHARPILPARRTRGKRGDRARIGPS